MLHAEEVPKIGYNDYKICQESKSFHIINQLWGILVTLMLEKLKPVKHKKYQTWIHMSMVFTVSL